MDSSKSGKTRKEKSESEGSSSSDLESLPHESGEEPSEIEPLTFPSRRNPLEITKDTKVCVFSSEGSLSQEKPSELVSEEIRKEPEVESSERFYTSNCECWLSYPSGAKERRDTANPSGRRGEAGLFYFVLDRNTPKARLVGDFRYPPMNVEENCLYGWYHDLAIPGDDDGGDIIRIPPPLPPLTSTPLLPLPLFSLTRLIHSTPQIDEDGDVLEPGVYEDVGISYSLPLYPPPSKLILSQQHPLPDEVDVSDNVELIGSCNGLYCLRYVCKGVSVIVWNPTTEVSRQLPPFGHSECLSLDGLIFGFGYDESSEDYKVVKIDADNLLVEVFSLYSNSNSWRTVHGFAQRWDFQSSSCNEAVSFAGCLNWIVSVDGWAMVASFDLATETFRNLPLPPTYGPQSHSLLTSSLWILDGCLSFVTLRGISPEWWPSVVPRILDIWIMREYSVGLSWTNAASVIFPHSVSIPYQILYLSKDALILNVQPSRLFVFYIKENALMCPHIQAFNNSRRGVEPYVQSKVSPYCRKSDAKEDED